MQNVRSHSVQKNYEDKAFEEKQEQNHKNDLSITRNNKLEYFDNVNKTTFNDQHKNKRSNYNKLQKDLKQLNKRLKAIKSNSLMPNDDSYNYNNYNFSKDQGLISKVLPYNNQGSISFNEFQLNNINKVKRMNEEALNKLLIM